jgi:predicted lipopolysaccharide heptosyltransferase III
VLIIQLKRIGDLILTTPLLAPLRARFPGCEITLAIDRHAAALAPALAADRVLIFQRGLRGAAFWRGLLARRWDLCLDATGNDRAALVSWLSRAGRKITWRRFAAKPLRRFLYTDFVESSVKERHTVDHHTDLLRPLGVEIENAAPALTLPDAARAEARRALGAAGAGEAFAVVHPGSARPEKYWIAGRWAEVIRALQLEHALPVVITGSADPREQAHVAEIQARLPQPAIDLTGKLPLLASAAVIARARIVCAVDSAPVHLADALGVPVVALFGPTNPFHWRPRNTFARVITPPAAGAIRPESPGAPSSEIPAAAVRAAINELLNAP